MLNFQRRRGFSLIELMVVIAILALLLAAAMPTFRTATSNGKVRSVAEDLANGLRMAQAEAMRRNRTVMFAMSSTTLSDLSATPTASALTLSTSGLNWYTLALTQSDGSDSPSYIQRGNYGTQAGVSIASGASAVCFGPLGSQVALLASASKNILGVACTVAAYNYTVSLSGADRSLRVVLSAGGQVRVCDTAKTLSASNPDGC